MLQEIKNRLGVNYIDDTDGVLLDMIEEYTNIALKTSNRKSIELLKPYIKEAVISDYLRRGAEGQKSRNEGSLSSAFVDIKEKLRNDLIKNGLRVLR